MENNIYDNLFNQNILPKYGPVRDIIYDNYLTEYNYYPHQYSISNRVNLCDIKTFTIDPPGCKDADDAFSIFFKNDKLFLAIHIADPTEYININSELWTTIQDRIITHYPSNKEPIHLMPDKIIKLASLTVENNSNTELKNAISIITEIDRNTYLPIYNIKLEFTKIQVSEDYTFSYNNTPINIEEIRLALKISKSLHTQRSHKTIGTKLSEINNIYTTFQNNNISLNLDSNNVKSLKGMIAEFAIFANSFIGEYLKINLDGMGIFRSCDGETVLSQHSNMTGQELLNQIINNGISAEYISTINSHDLVGTPVYCHFTSPIRRLADCICHYLLKSIKLSIQPPWSKDELDYLANKCYLVTKKERSLQYTDSKFRLIQLIDSLIDKNSIKIGFRINSYTGMFLNCIINKLYIDNIEYDIQISYTLRIINRIIKDNINFDTFSSIILVTTVNPYTKFDQGTIPSLDSYLKNNVFMQ